MRAIPFSSQSIATLNKMIASGHYEGHVNSKGFVLKRGKFPVNYVILGKQENELSFELTSELKHPTKTLVKPLRVLGLTILLLAMIYMNIMLIIAVAISALIIYVFDLFAKKREINLFLERFHVQQKLDEHDNNIN